FAISLQLSLEGALGPGSPPGATLWRVGCGQARGALLLGRCSENPAKPGYFARFGDFASALGRRFTPSQPPSAAHPVEVSSNTTTAGSAPARLAKTPMSRVNPATPEAISAP